MKNKIESAIVLGLALGFPAVAVAGTETPVTEAPASNPGDWCDWYGNKPGILYKNSDNPFIQEFQIEGRFQYQYGYVDGDSIGGGDWNENHDEVRRFRSVDSRHCLLEVPPAHQALEVLLVNGV